MIKVYGESMRYMSVKAVCKKFQIHRATLHRWIKKGLPVYKIGYRVLVDPNKVVAFLKKEAGK